MKKLPSPRGLLGIEWTKWFMPSLIAATAYRRFYKIAPNREQLEKYGFISKVMSGVYILLGCTATGFAFYKWKENNKTELLGDDEYVPEQFRTLARQKTPSSFDTENPKRLILYSIDGFNVHKEDVTEDIKKVVLGRHVASDEYDKYRDPDYLSRRSKMAKDDPRFDPDFWEAYYRKVDERVSTNDRLVSWFNSKI